jgi:hypothetical protein
MGRPKKDSTDKLEYHNVGFYAEELQLIHQYMDDLGVSFGAAVRIIVRNARRRSATKPFTRNEGTAHDDRH